MWRNDVILTSPKKVVKQMHSDNRPVIHPYAGIALGILAVSAASIIVKMIQNEHVPSLVISAYRLTLASLVLAPLALTRHRDEIKKLTRRDLLLIAVAGIFLALHFATWIESIRFTTIASSTVLVSTSPIFVGIFSWILLREKLSRMLIIGLVITVLGGVMIGFADSTGMPPTASAPDPLKGNVLAIAGAFAAAIYLLIGRSIRAKLSLIPYIFVCYSAAAITLLIAVLVAGENFWGYTNVAYVGVILLAIFPQLIGHSSFNWALRYLSATYVSITVLGEPIGSTILAFFIFKQLPPELTLIGGGLILIGILIASKQ
jgi:drug/metabolite transporter (DMT)-like permease